LPQPHELQKGKIRITKADAQNEVQPLIRSPFKLKLLDDLCGLFVVDDRSTGDGSGSGGGGSGSSFLVICDTPSLFVDVLDLFRRGGVECLDFLSQRMLQRLFIITLSHIGNPLLLINFACFGLGARESFLHL